MSSAWGCLVEIPRKSSRVQSEHEARPRRCQHKISRVNGRALALRFLDDDLKSHVDMKCIVENNIRSGFIRGKFWDLVVYACAGLDFLAPPVAIVWRVGLLRERVFIAHSDRIARFYKNGGGHVGFILHDDINHRGARCLFSTRRGSYKGPRIRCKPWADRAPFA